MVIMRISNKVPELLSNDENHFPYMCNDNTLDDWRLKHDSSILVILYHLIFRK